MQGTVKGKGVLRKGVGHQVQKPGSFRLFEGEFIWFQGTRKPAFHYIRELTIRIDSTAFLGIRGGFEIGSGATWAIEKGDPHHTLLSSCDHA